jgi:hypothetical protein
MKPWLQEQIVEDLEFSEIARFLKSNYGLDVLITSDSDAGLNSEIAALQGGILTVNAKARTNNCRIFLVSHVFGHIVQYCSSNRYLNLITSISDSAPPITLSPALRILYNEYEVEAFSIGLGLLKSVYKLTEDEEIQFQAFMKTDIHHYMTFLTSGRASSEREFNELYGRNLEAMRSQAFRPATFMLPPAWIDPRMAKEIYVL